jgi:predicted solute-binding protein
MIRDAYAQAFVDSCKYGMEHVGDMAREQAPIRGISETQVREYLTRNVVFDLGEKEHRGLELYLKQALALDRVIVPAGA